MGIGEDFQIFCSKLVVDNQSDISYRYNRITARLNDEYWNTTSETAHSFYTGSYGRNTARRGFHDLDMLFEIPSEVYVKYYRYQSNGPSALLQDVRRAIQGTYPSSEVGGDGQVVVVNFTDGMRFEVVPGFGGKDGYIFPDANGGGSWKTTNPKPEIEAIRARNAAVNFNLVPLCRMMRAWKHAWDVPMGGLLIDTLAHAFIENWAWKEKSFLYYDWMARDFFAYMKDQPANQLHWRAPGSGQYVYRKGNFEYKALRAYNISVEAIDKYPASTWTARQKWREIFGTSFPES